MVIPVTRLRCCAAAALGYALTTAHPLAIASAIFMPALALSQPSRRAANAAALCYYGAALWPLMPCAKNFFGPDASALAAIALWAFAAAVLAVAWRIVWSPDRRQAVWRSPLGLFLTVIPPLGIIGFASPLTAAGFLFPRTGWCGLLACAALSGAVAAWPRRAVVALVCCALAANLSNFHNPAPLSGWQGINTNFGAIAHERVNPITEYHAAQWIQQYALSADAKVIVFPETVVPTWTAATEAFWQQTLDRLRASGKTILVGARLPFAHQRQPQARYDFSADVVALRGAQTIPLPAVRRSGHPSDGFLYDNAVLLRGAETADFVQRIPVPIGMWHPFRPQGARMNLFGPPVVTIAGERAAILVCYEQVVTWPVLTAVLHHPSVLVAVANDHWAMGTPIPALQSAAVRAWSRLFGIPAVSATNR
jgi:Carbon-nitrogen hydrolase